MEKPTSGLWEHTACRIRKTVRRECRSPEDPCPDVPLTLQGDSFAAYGLHRPGFSPAGTAEGEGISVSFWKCVDDEAVLSVKSAASPSVSFQRVCKPMPSATVRIIQEPVRKTNGPRGSILPPGPLYGSVCFTFWHPAPVSVCFRAFPPPAGPVHTPAAVRWYQSSCR